MDLKLIIAGDGPEEEKLINYSKELNIFDRVHFLGFVEDMRSFYDDIDIYCISSTTEDLPLSVIEAMMSGKPIIASNVGGIPDILKNINYTILVDNFYDKIEIDHIYNMLKSCNKTNCAEYLNKIAFSQFDNKTYCKKLTTIYKDLI